MTLQTTTPKYGITIHAVHQNVPGYTHPDKGYTILVWWLLQVLHVYTCQWGSILRSTPSYHCKILKCADDYRIVSDWRNLNGPGIHSPGKVTLLIALSAVYGKFSGQTPAGGAPYSEPRSRTTTVFKRVDHCGILKERQSLYEPDMHSPGILYQRIYLGLGEVTVTGYSSDFTSRFCEVYVRRGP